MYRLNKKDPSFGRNLTSWKGCTWTVILDVNSRMSVVGATAVCTRTMEDGSTYQGIEATHVAPFDDLGKVLGDLMADAAINSLDALLDSHQPELWNEPPAV